MAIGGALALIVALIVGEWAVPNKGAAHSRLAHSSDRPAQGRSGSAQRRVPSTVRFRNQEGPGLTVATWVNDSGPYRFAIDTGAGATILSPHVAQEANVPLRGKENSRLGGLTGLSSVSGQTVAVDRLAIGDRSNLLPGKGETIVAGGLPEDVDGVIDPTEAFWPLGYVIDIPNSEISGFDPRATPLRRESAPPGGAVVRWVSDGESRRPFVNMDHGGVALLDTGSGFGLAVTERAARRLGIESRAGEYRETATDISGGSITSKRVSPATVQIGALQLKGVPTDLLTGVEDDSPILLGRDALRPFRLTFDPIARLIQFDPK
jgi:predicted aspartyl protease